MTTYKALVPVHRDVTAWPGWCLATAQAIFRAPVAHDRAWTAWEAIPGNLRHRPDEPLPTVPVPVWFEHFGTYTNPATGVPEYKNWGHVVVHVPGVGFLSSPAYQARDAAGTPVPSLDVYHSIGEIERIYAARCVGWSEAINGLRVCAPEAAGTVGAHPYKTGPESRQRTVGPHGARRRVGPGTSHRENGVALAAGVVGNFVGYGIGENVQGNPVWFKGISGDWFWSGGFTDPSVTGLPDVTPKVRSRMFTMLDREVIARAAPRNGAAVLSVFKPKAGKPNRATVTGWTRGDTPAGGRTNIWYRLHAQKSGRTQWMHASTFADEHYEGLPEVKP